MDKVIRTPHQLTGELQQHVWHLESQDKSAQYKGPRTRWQTKNTPFKKALRTIQSEREKHRGKDEGLAKAMQASVVLQSSLVQGRGSRRQERCTP